MSLIRKHGAVLQAWACSLLSLTFKFGPGDDEKIMHIMRRKWLKTYGRSNICERDTATVLLVKIN